MVEPTPTPVATHRFEGWAVPLVILLDLGGCTDGAARRFFLNGVTPSGRLDYRDDIVEKLETTSQQTYGGSPRPDWPVAVRGTEGTANIGRGRFQPSSSFWAGDLAELLIYDTALVDVELAGLGAYVACSYGLE